MDDVGQYIIVGLLILIFLGLSAIFAGFETAILYMSKGMLKKMEKAGDSKAKKLAVISENSHEYRIYCSVVAISFIVAINFVSVHAFAPLIDLPTQYSSLIVFIITLIISLMLGKIIPKKIAANFALNFAMQTVSLITVIGVLTKPIAFGLIRLCEVFSSKPDIEITEEEIRMLVEDNSSNIDQSEREMINNIFDFDDTTVENLMTHRTDIVSVNREQPIADLLKVAIEGGFSRIPVYDKDIDNISGFVYVKDMLSLVLENNADNHKVAEFIRDVIYVPTSTKALALFGMFKEKRMHIAVIVDEYGGTAGIVTMEDVIECVLGNIQDEYDKEEDPIRRINMTSYSVSGALSIEEINSELNISLPYESQNDTVGALILNTLGKIPNDGETPSIEVDNIKLKAFRISERRVQRVFVTIKEPPSSDQ